MKNKILLIGLAFSLILFVAASVPILNGLLQSNLNANGYSITNLASLTDTNGNPITGGNVFKTGQWVITGTNANNYLEVTNTTSGDSWLDLGGVELHSLEGNTFEIYLAAWPVSLSAPAMYFDASHDGEIVLQTPNVNSSLAMEDDSGMRLGGAVEFVNGPVTNLGTLFQKGTVYITNNNVIWSFGSDGTFKSNGIAPFDASGSAASKIPNNTGAGTNTILVNPTGPSITNWNTFYVSPNGSDANVGNSQFSPWLTITNAINLLPVNANLVIMPGAYFNLITNGGMYIPKGATISGFDSQMVSVTNAGAGSLTLQNTTMFCLSDNSTVEHLNICIGTNPIPANNNGWTIALAGHGRGHQSDGYPHYADTCTNFLIRDIVSYFPADHQSVVFDSTNTFWGTVRDCYIVGENAYVVQVGNTVANGAFGHQQGTAITIGTNYVNNPLDGVTFKNNTFIETNSLAQGVATGEAPLLFSTGTNNYVSSDTHLVYYSQTAQPTAGVVADGTILCGTNTTLTWATTDCSFQGNAATWTNGGGCTLGTIVITGVSNTLNLLVPVNVVDIGNSDVINYLYQKGITTNIVSTNIFTGSTESAYYTNGLLMKFTIP